MGSCRPRQAPSSDAYRCACRNRAGSSRVGSCNEEMLLVDGRKDTTEPVAGFTLKDSSRTLSLMPQPLRVKPGVVVTAGKTSARITWPDALERPPAKLDPQTQRERDAHALMVRAQSVLDRLHDVESALADP